MNKIITISRDPFARCATIRQVIHTNKTCNYCGQNHKGRLFQYGTYQDGINTKPEFEVGHFCRKTCRDLYYSY